MVALTKGKYLLEKINKNLHSTSALDQLNQIYENSDDSVRVIGISSESALQRYSSYCKFIAENTDLKSSKVLDVGCGNGWSSFFIAENAKEVIGLDLHADKYECPKRDNLSFIKGSAIRLPFKQETFDLVCVNECLEHITNPEEALKEFNRVLKPKGIIVIVGPNLYSLGQSLRALFVYLWQVRPITSIFFRTKQTPKHPFGNTLFEVSYYLFRNFFLFIGIFLRKTPKFEMRTPDLNPPFHADNDACYYLNVKDLTLFFQMRGYKIISPKIGIKNLTKMYFRSGTWFAAKK